MRQEDLEAHNITDRYTYYPICSPCFIDDKGLEKYKDRNHKLDVVNREKKAKKGKTTK